MVSDRFRNRHLYAPLGAVRRPRQRPQQLFCVAREGIFAPAAHDRGKNEPFHVFETM